MQLRWYSESYKIGFAALDAVWEKHPCESLAALLGAMAVNRGDEVPMDSGCLDDWEQVVDRSDSSNTIDLILEYLDLDASRYEVVPDDLRHLIDALGTKGTPEREIVDDVIAKWHLDPQSWPLYAHLTPQDLDS